MAVLISPLRFSMWRKHMMQAGKRRFAGNVIGGANLLFRNQGKCLAHGLRCVMESRFQRHFRIVQAIGVELHLGAAGASSEKVDGAAFAYHVNRPLPSFGTAQRLQSPRLHRAFPEKACAPRPLDL